MCSTAPSLAPRRSSPVFEELAAYRITQQVPHDDPVVRCRYTVSAEEVFQLLQTLRKIHLLTKGRRRSSLGDDASNVSPVRAFPVTFSHPHTDQDRVRRTQGEQKQDGLHPGRSQRRTTEGRKRQSMPPLRRGSDGTPRTPSTPTVRWSASLPHQVIRRMSPSQPRICYEALPLQLPVLMLGGVMHPLGLVPPEISTCVSVLFANLDLRIHLLNVRQQPYSLSGEQPPTGRSGWWVLLPAGPSRSSSVEFNKALSSCAFSPVDRVVWEIPGPYQWLILRCRFSPAVCNQDSLCHSPPGVA
ncbi:hypothetical protein T06_3756 [Trichinella sp. T6]|nr:hypothetical protein T06_3756 [Trichinella sp. T6]